MSYEDEVLKTNAMIQHRLFLLGQQNSETVYSLQCEIKVCDRNNGSSDCNLWSGCLTDVGEQEEYICDAEMEASCEVGYECNVGTSDANEGTCDLIVVHTTPDLFG